MKKARSAWEIDDDVRTLERAQEIRSDADRLSEAQAKMKEIRDTQDKLLRMKPLSSEKSVPRNKATLGKLPHPN